VTSLAKVRVAPTDGPTDQPPTNNRPPTLLAFTCYRRSA
jgi:hypothetical protein